MEEGTPADDDHIHSALADLLRRHPGALVGAVDADGLFVPFPASVHLTGQVPMRGRSPIDLVAPADLVTVIDAWERVKEHGTTSASVHLVAVPDRTVVFHLFDARGRHGAFIVVVPLEGDHDVLERVTRSTEPTPRVVRTRKTEMSVFVEVDPAAEQLLGWRPDELVGRRSLDLVHPDDQGRSISVWMEMLAHPGESQRCRLRYRRADGSWLWVELHDRNALLDPDERCVVGEVIDVSDEMAAHEAVRAREQLLHRLAEALPTGVLQLRPDGAVVYTNARLHEILAVPRMATVGEQLATVTDDDREVVAATVGKVLAGADADVEAHVDHPDHPEPRLCRMSLRALTDDDGSVAGAIMTVEDITESATMRRELEWRATFDPVTGSLNRSSVMEVLDSALRAGNGPVAVIFVDLDRFKAVNDHFGHAAGDELLAVVADRIREAVRDLDVVGRIGGDEFLVVCRGAATEGEALEIAERVADAVQQPASLAAGTVALRASIGVVHALAGTATPDELVARADEAMYESKTDARGRPVVHRAA